MMMMMAPSAGLFLLSPDCVEIKNGVSHKVHAKGVLCSSRSCAQPEAMTLHCIMSSCVSSNSVLDCVGLIGLTCSLFDSKFLDIVPLSGWLLLIFLCFVVVCSCCLVLID